MLTAGSALAVAACGSTSTTAYRPNAASGSAVIGQQPPAAVQGSGQQPPAPLQGSGPKSQGQLPGQPTNGSPAVQGQTRGIVPAPNPGAPAPAPKAASVPVAPTQNFASDVGVTNDTITVGLINFTSATRSLGPVIAGASQRMSVAQVQWINENGGVAGRKLKLLICDDGGDVTRARACYEKLRGQVFALLPSETFLTDTIHDQLDKDKVPWMTWGWFASEYKDPYMFPCHGNGLRETANIAEWLATQKHPQTVGIMYLNDAEDIAGKDAAIKILQLHGIKVVVQIAQEWDSPDETQHVIAMRAANPDAILTPTWPTPLTKFFHDAEGQQYAPPLGYYGKHLVADPGYGQIFGDYVKDRFYSINSWVNPGGLGNTPAEEALPGLQLMRMLSAKFTGYDNNGFHMKYTLGHHITQGALACTTILTDIARQIGPNLTRAALINALESQSFNSGAGQILRWPRGDHGREPYSFHTEPVYLWTGSPDGSFETRRVRPDAVTPTIPG